MTVVMQLWGTANGQATEHDGQWLKDFDFEAEDGRGLITMTKRVGEAKRFADMGEAMEFYRRQPECKPLREDGKPNRPLTSTNWAFATLGDRQA